MKRVPESCSVRNCQGRPFMAGPYCLVHLPEKPWTPESDVTYSNVALLRSATLETLAGIIDHGSPQLAVLAKEELQHRCAA